MSKIKEDRTIHGEAPLFLSGIMEKIYNIDSKTDTKMKILITLITLKNSGIVNLSGLGASSCFYLKTMSVSS
jgi:hypothetical protein